MTVEEWLGKNNQLGQDIWHKKYQHNGETFEEWIERVSGGDSDVASLIKEKKFLFGGRILANRGLQNKGKKITYSNCFKAGTKVLTKSGYRPIEAIQIGEQVYTHDGSLQVVNEVMKRDYSGDLYRISGKEIYNDIYCTPNHQFLTNNGWKRADELVFCSNGHKKIDKLCTINERIPIKPLTIDLLEGINLPENREICYNGNNDVGLKQCIISEHFNNYWREPRFNNYVHQHITIDEDMSYFIGRWLGDGSITKRKDSSLYSILQIVFNAQTERAAFERCKSIGEKAFGISASYRETNQNTIALRFENALVGDWFYRNFGAGCDGKHVNTERFGYNFYMLLGLLDADGSVHKQGDFKLLLKNQNLVLWARDTLFNNGINSSQIKSETRQTADYFTIFKHQNQKLIPYLTKIYNDNRMDLIQTDCFIKISDIEKLSDQHLTVYNLSVENNHNYIVEGVVAHNCYVIEPPKDNIESIYKTASKLARTYSYGGGCGIDISKLAPKGAPVNNAANETSGAVSFMDTFSQVTEQIGQNGRRKLA